MRRAIFWILCVLAVVLTLTLAFGRKKEARKEDSGVIVTSLPLDSYAPLFDVTNVFTHETRCYL
ncbi:MAG: hypothetical protein IT210_07140 [Armatimonadetes bacterium]|nr:hypothetical protein [Armatimonadota bacterium]